MRKLLFAVLFLSTFLNCAPNLRACRMPAQSPAPLFWLKAPDDQPGAFFSRREWQAEDQFSRCAIRTQDDKPAAALLPLGWENLFTACLLHAQEPDGNDPLVLPQGEPVNDDSRPRQGPSIIASRPAGVTLFVMGILGWIALGVCVLLLERRATPT